MAPQIWPGAMYFVINRSPDGNYFYRIVHDDDETAAVSESFPTTSAVREAITILKQQLPDALVVDLTTQPYGERRAP